MHPPTQYWCCLVYFFQHLHFYLITSLLARVLTLLQFLPSMVFSLLIRKIHEQRHLYHQAITSQYPSHLVTIPNPQEFHSMWHSESQIILLFILEYFHSLFLVPCDAPLHMFCIVIKGKEDFLFMKCKSCTHWFRRNTKITGIMDSR